MHPRYKTRYFVKSGWEDEWVQEAVELAREAWTNRYKERSANTRLPNAMVVDPGPSVNSSCLVIELYTN
jgi:hypothetical protein